MLGQELDRQQDLNQKGKVRLGVIAGYVLGVVVLDSFFLIGLPLMVRESMAENDTDAAALSRINRPLAVNGQAVYEVAIWPEDDYVPPEQNKLSLACYNPVLY